ncbi:MAG TPA: class I SAM-dependent methyltransferase [Candidatus Dormibacteraeota bacterium]
MDPERWSRYAQAAMEAGALRTTFDNWTYQATTLGYMLQWQPPPARVISIGCGVGWFDILLLAWGYQVTSVDNDAEVLEAAERLGQRFGVERDLQQADAFDLLRFHDRYDIAYSGGLVEHWNGERTTELIAEHARCAPRVQVEVPTVHTLRLPEGMPEVLADAKLYRPREFVARVRAAELTINKVYPIGSVPIRTRVWLENLMPPFLFRRFQLLSGLSMGVGCVASRTR